MTEEIRLDAESFYQKIQKIFSHWDKHTEEQRLNKASAQTDFDAFLVVMGKVREEPVRPLTSDFIMWLLLWEFSDTVILMLQDRIVFGVSPRKSKILRQLSQDRPNDFCGPYLDIVERSLKSEPIADFVKRMLQKVPSGVKNIGSFCKDSDDGELTESVLSQLKQSKNIVDMAPFIESVATTKLDCEEKNMQIASEFSNWALGRVIEEVEAVIEDDQKVKHSSIQDKIEKLLEDSKEMSKFTSLYPQVNSDFLEFPKPVMIQSGNHFSVHEFCSESNDDYLNSNSIYINVCSKYCDMSAMVSRTLLIDPKPEQRQAYLIAYDALELLISNLRAGQKISSAYSSAMQMIATRCSDLKTHQNFGFGIGFNHRENNLTINAQNETVVQEGMTFHVRIVLQGVHKDPSRSVIAIGDTVVVKSPKNIVLTSKAQKQYSEISYSLNEDQAHEKPKSARKVDQKTEDVSGKDSGKQKTKTGSSVDEEESELSEGSQDVMKNGLDNVIVQSRLRSRGQQQMVKQDEAEERQENQRLLHKRKAKELKVRFDRGDIKTQSAKKKMMQMDQICAYKSSKDYPKDLVPGQIYVDMKRHAVLVPNSPNTHIPLSVSTIKSVQDTIQGQWTFMRINFNFQNTNSIQFPSLDDPNHLFVKGISLKSQGSGIHNRLSIASKQIKECMKLAKAKELEKELKVQSTAKDQEQLITARQGKREVLDHLTIRPNLGSRKTIGALEIHQNGVRFMSAKGQSVDICFTNVKHCFYSPCASDELIVILHFNLVQPILLNDKKVTDVQFYRESGVAAEDINAKSGRKRNDMDELEEEEAERHARKRLNQRFHNFSKLIEQAAQKNRTPLDVDIPEDDLSFYGCPGKQVVKIRPTKDCLIAISEFPFFVLDVSDIEVVHFERMFFGMKNFDLAIVFKDFQSFTRINSIPTEHTEELKTYFNEIGIIFIESLSPYKWQEILSTIKEDFKGWLDDGAWLQLVDDGDGAEAEESEDEEDPGCSYGDDDESSESEDYSDVSDEESSEVDNEDQLSDEGMSWDEHERQAVEEDRKFATSSKPNLGKGFVKAKRR